MAKNPKSYTAPEGVYTGGRLYAAGEVFVTDQEPNDNWKAVGKTEKAALDAADKTQHGDAPLEGIGLSGLRALAADKRVNHKGLSEAELITAIKAADEPAL